jgi:hypothetical protein
MTDQHPGYREDWDITSKEGSLCFASAIYSRLVGGEQDEATLQWLAKYLRANAPPRNHTAMNDQHRATPEQWEELQTVSQSILKMHAPHSCILELRARVEALEARNETQRQATLEWSGDVLRLIMALEAGQKTPPPAVDRARDLQDQIRDGSLTLAEALDLGVLPASDVQDAMRRAASKAMSEVALEMGGFGKNYTYRAPAAPAPTDSYCDIWNRFQLEAGQKISSGPESSLVERVADAIAAEATSAGIVNDRPARAAIREVAAALIDWHDSDEVVRTAYEAGQWLKREADA